MTPERRVARIKRLKLLSGVALALMALAFIGASFSQNDVQQSARVGDLVFPNFATVRDDAARIEVTLADESYTLIRTGDTWRYQNAGGYLVKQSLLSSLAEGFETMKWVRARTEDPEKFNRIGLGDPRDGGTGALVEIFSESGELEASLITGRKDDHVYARRPDELLSFRINSDLPPLYSGNAWLDLDIVDINEDAIAAVRLYDEKGEETYLRRQTGSGSDSFRPGPPFQDYRLTSQLRASATALALTRLRPSGVIPADALTTRPVARHITETFDGLEVDLKAYREPTGLFVTLRAIEAGEGARRGSTINQKSEGWAFRVSELEWEEFTPLVTTLVRAPSTG